MTAVGDPQSSVTPVTARPLRGRVALVTGADRGIGRAIALGLADQGADVAVHALTRDDEAEAVCRAVEESGARAWLLTGDLADPGLARRLVEQASERLGPPTIVVHNASVEIRRPWSDISHDEFRLQMDVNVWSAIALFQGATPAMIEAGWGRLIVVGSVQQRLPHPQMLVYAAGKAALVNIMSSLATQLGPSGVTANIVAPGVIRTDRTRRWLDDPAYGPKLRDAIAVRGFGEPEDVAAAVLLLAGDAGRYITGAVVPVDGGKTS